ncbi:glycosyltransferase family A protein [Pseudovibrio sp. POLY-S9]|uniref:glycosyltransferase family 2 protein n=1 Tax=Pseudovibrio sp. POLY-S9 TaxID=1576596 RepID=UPI00070C96DD|nr:glycosyltransferase family A protein [Pseudovibrio sp. POLY-S9]
MKISIIIPTYGRELSLTELVSQIDAQAATNTCKVEVIIVDDHSLAEICIYHECRNIDLILLRNPKRIGANLSRKIGFSHSQGDIIHFHDSDDLIGPDWLALTYKAFEVNSHLDVLITSRLVVDEKNRKVTFIDAKRLSKICKNIPRLKRLQFLVNRVGPLGGVTFHRRIVTNLPFHDVRASQDWLMYDDALASANLVSVDPHNFFIFRKKEIDRISRNPNNRLRGYISAAQRRFKSRRSRKLIARLYCVQGASELNEVLDIKFLNLKLLLIGIVAWVASV